MSFSYCLNSSTVRPAPILEKIRIAGACGYSAIELWHDDMDQLIADGGSLSDVVKALNDSKLAVPTTIHMKDWFDSIGPAHVAAMEECKRKLEQAREVGSTYTVAGPPHGTADRALGARNYRDLLELGASIGVTPAMEFLGFVDDINTIEDAWEIITHADRPDGCIVMDPFHVFRGGGSMESIKQIPGDRIAICHFNDSPVDPPREQQHDKDRVFPGDGHVDLKSMIRYLREVDFNGYISLELFNPTYWEMDLEEVARIGLDKMRTVVEN